jgi:cytochrome c-type biogenesis protein CcmH/NrfF
VTIIAHHALVETLPFFAPMLVVVAGIAVLTLRDRRRQRRDAR